MSTPSLRVMTLSEPEHAFLAELMNRVVREGLLVPDELGYAAALWARVRGAQPVTPPQPEATGDAEPETSAPPVEETPDA